MNKLIRLSEILKDSGVVRNVTVWGSNGMFVQKYALTPNLHLEEEALHIRTSSVLMSEIRHTAVFKEFSCGEGVSEVIVADLDSTRKQLPEILQWDTYDCDIDVVNYGCVCTVDDKFVIDLMYKLCTDSGGYPFFVDAYKAIGHLWWG